MIGMPAALATQTDIQNCLGLVQAGKIDASALVEKLEGLIASEKVWQFKAEVDSEYTPATDEKVIEDDSVYTCYELVDNPNADFLRMGMTKAAIQSLITQLGG